MVGRHSLNSYHTSSIKVVCSCLFFEKSLLHQKHLNALSAFHVLWYALQISGFPFCVMCFVYVCVFFPYIKGYIILTYIINTKKFLQHVLTPSGKSPKVIYLKWNQQCPTKLVQYFEFNWHLQKLYCPLR